MKHLLLTTIAAVLLVGCGESQQSTPAPEAKPEPPTAKAPDISIHDAAKKGNPEDVKLHDAAEKGNLEAVKQHLAAGADVNAKNNVGWTPLDLAILMNEKEIADLLRKHGGKTGAWLDADKSIHTAARAGHIEAVKQHIAAGADVNAKLDRGYTALQGAAGRGHKEIAELLIAEGANVNAKVNGGETPLDRAKRHPETADLLRKHGGKTGEELK